MQQPGGLDTGHSSTKVARFQPEPQVNDTLHAVLGPAVYVAFSHW